MADSSPVLTLHAISRSFGSEAAARKEDLLRKIASQRRFRVKELTRLHDTLNFMRAYPDNRRVHRRSTELIARLRDHAGAASLRNTGFPGSTHSYPFSYAVLQRLTLILPGCLEIDWDETEDTDTLEGALSLIVTAGENEGLEDTRLTVEEWLSRNKGNKEQTDLELVLGMLERSELSPRVRANLFEVCGLPILYSLHMPGSSRSEALFPPGRLHYQKRGIAREPLDLPRRIAKPLANVSTVSPGAGRKLVDVALVALCSRNLEIYPLTHANPRDVTLAECGRGMQVALVGVVPEFRNVLESLYFYLVLKNGVPIAYGPASAFLGCCEMGINLFPEYRGGEIRYLCAQLMRVLHHVLWVRYFFLTRYGMGEDNEDAIESGSFWFYRKLDFETTNPDVEALAREEEAKMRVQPSYRSDKRTLRRLSHTEAVLDLSNGLFRPTDFGKLGLLQTEYIATQFHGDRAHAEARSAAAVANILQMPQEGTALTRLAPLLCMIPDLEAWSFKDKARLASIIRAKDGRSEIRAARLFSRHARLRAALEQLSDT